MAHLISRIGLEPIILHEQPNRGRTIIEKFFDHSDVGFTVVLLSPDDKSGLASESPDKYKFRARQNVIMELGFFLGRLGRVHHGFQLRACGKELAQRSAKVRPHPTTGSDEGEAAMRSELRRVTAKAARRMASA